MNRRSTFAGVIALLAFTLTPFSAQATTAKPRLVWCQGCTGIQKFQLLDNQPPGSTVYIADAINDTIDAYSIDAGPHRPSPYMPMPGMPTPITPEPSLVAGIQAGIDFYNSSPVGWHKAISLSINNQTYPGQEYPGSAYNVINAGPARNQFNDDLNGMYASTASFLVLGHFIQALGSLHIVNASDGPTVSVTLTFEDGSTVKAFYDETSGELKIDPDSAEDSHHNNVPYLGEDGKIHDLGGIHDFSTPGNAGDQQNFLNQLRTLGIEIGDNSHGWACVQAGSGDSAVYTCTAY